MSPKMIALNEISFRDRYVLDHLRRFLENASNKYKNFDQDQTVWVYASPWNGNDFMAFESREYALGFSSNNYKISNFMKGDVVIASCPIKNFLEYVRGKSVYA